MGGAANGEAMLARGGGIRRGVGAGVHSPDTWTRVPAGAGLGAGAASRPVLRPKSRRSTRPRAAARPAPPRAIRPLAEPLRSGAAALSQRDALLLAHAHTKAGGVAQASLRP